MTEMTKFQDCSDYISSRGYNARPQTQDELDFPIAYESLKITKVTFLSGRFFIWESEILTWSILKWINLKWPYALGLNRETNVP